MNDTNAEKKEEIFQKPPITKVYPKTLNDSDEINEETEILEREVITPLEKPYLEIIGTAHISEESVDTVKQTIYANRPEIVAIELDSVRYQTLVNESYGIKREEKFDLKKTLKSSNLIVTLVTVFLSYTQKKMGENVGVKPGSEMLEAARIAQEVGAEIALIDRNINVTLERTINGMTLKEKLSFLWELLTSFFSDEEDLESSKEEIENLKQEDVIEEVMEVFKEASPGGYNALVHERDAYMAYHLKSLEDKNVVAVVGAGHKRGISTFLENPDTIPSRESLSTVEKSKFSISKIILYSIPILFILIFIIAFFQGINIKGGLINYLIFAGGGAFLGSLFSGSKIQSAIVAMLVAPITVIHPLLAAGWFSGIVEGKLRKVGFNDLQQLTEFESFSDLWHNKLFRVILVVLGTNIGCTIGVLITINNVFLPYTQVILGL